MAETAVPPTPSPQPPTPSPQPPTPSPTPAPLTIRFDAVVPAELKTAVEAVIQAHPEQFALAETEADLALTVQEEAPIGEWIFAVAAPFPTIADDISLTAVQEAWLNGSLFLTPEMDAVLRGWWGDPAVAATIVAPELLIETLWQTQTAYDARS
jgi:hypothetical protein